MRQRDKRTERQRGREIKRQSAIDKNAKSDRETNRQKYRVIKRQRLKNKETETEK